MTVVQTVSDSEHGTRHHDIIVNGDGVRLQARTLAEAVVELGFGDVLVATALNGAFVPTAARSATMLTNGDKLEVVAPRAGG